MLCFFRYLQHLPSIAPGFTGPASGSPFGGGSSGGSIRMPLFGAGGINSSGSQFGPLSTSPVNNPLAMFETHRPGESLIDFPKRTENH